jgi:hypothetical protein
MALINCDPQLLGRFNGSIRLELIAGRRRSTGRSFVIRGVGHAEQSGHGLKVAQKASAIRQRSQAPLTNVA